MDKLRKLDLMLLKNELEMQQKSFNATMTLGILFVIFMLVVAIFV